MKNIIITGVSRGLGKELANYLISKNYFVHGSVRNLDGFKNSHNIKYYYLDLQNQKSIDTAISEILENEKIIDAIIHNAGIAYLSPADVMTDKERRQVFEVNFFGPIYLMEKLLPHFRKQRKGKLIFISSIASIDPWPGLGVYSASKAAIEKIAFEWGVLLKKWNIDVSIIRPNPLPTDMQIMETSNKDANWYGSFFNNELVWEKVERVCAIVEEIIESASPKFEYTSGEESYRIIDTILVKNAYQNLLEDYRKKYLSSS